MMKTLLLCTLCFVLTATTVTAGYITFRTSPFASGGMDMTNGVYPAGTNLVITATNNPAFDFSEWTGDVPSSNATDNPLTLYVTTNTAFVQANFKRMSFAEELTANGATVIDLHNLDYDKFHITLTGDSSFTFTNTVDHEDITLYIEQPATNTYTVTWDTNLFRFRNNIAPTNVPVTNSISTYYYEYIVGYGYLLLYDLPNIRK